jgi:hypothetical protein
VIAAGVTRFTENRTTPWENTVAVRTDDGVVAGPAAIQKTGTPVELVQTGPSPYTPMPADTLPENQNPGDPVDRGGGGMNPPYPGA